MVRDLALGIDLGGTQLRVAVVDRSGGIVARAATDTDVQGGPTGVVAQIRRLCIELLLDRYEGRIAGIGVSAPGPLDSETGVIIAIPTLPGWDGFRLAAALEEAFRLPVIVENDGIAAANGEWRFGAAKGLDHFVYVTVSTGIVGGVVMDGRLLRGRRGMAGHIGHMIIDPAGPPCSCGARGCFEALASGSALGLAGREAAADPTSGFARTSMGRTIDARAVVEAARATDSVALRLLEQEARYLGIGFSNLAHLYSPQAVIMGGGVSQAFDLLSGTIMATFLTTAMPPFRDMRIEPALLGDNAGLAGAAAMVWEKDGHLS